MGAPFTVMRAKRARNLKNRAHFLLNHGHLRRIAGENRATSESVHARKLSKGKLQQESWKYLAREGGLGDRFCPQSTKF